MHSTLLCMVALAELFPVGASPSYTKKVGATYLDRLEICVRVSNTAETMGVKPSLAVAVAFEESRFREDKTSKAGAMGPLQVIPRYGCPGGKVKGCNLIEAGLRVLKLWRGKYRRLALVLCHYNAGNRCTKASRVYARKVISRQARLKTQLSAVSYDFERF